MIKLKDFLKRYKNDLIIALCIFSITVIAFNLGRYSVNLRQSQIIIEQKVISSAMPNITKEVKKGNVLEDGPSFAPPSRKASEGHSKALGGKVIASKNSRKYHYPWCIGAKRIAPENQVWFETAKEAESRGLSLAKNCS